MFEPNNAFEFAGYHLTGVVEKLATNEELVKVGCYGGDPAEVEAFVKDFRSKGHDEGVELFLNSPPYGVTLGFSMSFTPATEEEPELILIETFDYISGVRAELKLPFQRRKRFQQLKLGNLELAGVWGRNANTHNLKENAVLHTLAGCRLYPNAQLIWAGKFMPESKLEPFINQR